MGFMSQYTDINGNTYDIRDRRIPALPNDAKQVLNGTGAWSALVDMVYPVGSVYMSMSSTDPGTLFGGTWSPLENRFLVGAGDLYSVGTNGGEATHTLTEAEMPTHEHLAVGTNASENGQWTYAMIQNITGVSGTLPVANGTDRITFATNSGLYSDLTIRDHTGAKGGGAAHNNLPPYTPVYMWERTA